MAELTLPDHSSLAGFSLELLRTQPEDWETVIQTELVTLADTPDKDITSRFKLRSPRLVRRIALLNMSLGDPGGLENYLRYRAMSVSSHIPGATREGIDEAITRAVDAYTAYLANRDPAILGREAGVRSARDQVYSDVVRIIEHGITDHVVWSALADNELARIRQTIAETGTIVPDNFDAPYILYPHVSIFAPDSLKQVAHGTGDISRMVTDVIRVLRQKKQEDVLKHPRESDTEFLPGVIVPDSYYRLEQIAHAIVNVHDHNSPFTVLEMALKLRSGPIRDKSIIETIRRGETNPAIYRYIIGGRLDALESSIVEAKAALDRARLAGSVAPTQRELDTSLIKVEYAEEELTRIQSEYERLQNIYNAMGAGNRRAYISALNYLITYIDSPAVRESLGRDLTADSEANITGISGNDLDGLIERILARIDSGDL
jgi:hypothetical protein